MHSKTVTIYFLLRTSRQMQTVKGKQHSFLQKREDKQTTFLSTKKRREILTTLSKPSGQDSNLCKSKIVQGEPLFCGACFKENDSNHTNIEISLIQ